MSAAIITLEDDGEGVAVKLIFSGGFDKTSKAHQAGQILIGLADEYMQRMGNAVIDPVVEAKAAEDASLAVPDAEASRIILEA
jgi:hypothetical protein